MHLPYVTNLGVDNSDEEKIIILESDRILPPGYFKNTIDSMKPGVVTSPKQMIKLSEDVDDNTIEFLVNNVHDRKDSLNYTHIRHHEDRSDTNKMGQKNVFSGNTAIMKSDYIKAGKMDESYIGHGWADTDMTDTVIKAGMEIQFIPDVMEIHLFHELKTYATVNYLGDRFVENGLYYCKKWNLMRPAVLIEGLKKKIFV
jgi:hypothetical protein